VKVSSTTKESTMQFMLKQVQPYTPNNTVKKLKPN